MGARHEGRSPLWVKSAVLTGGQSTSGLPRSTDILSLLRHATAAEPGGGGSDRIEGQRLGSDAITSPASASSRQGVTVNGSRSAHWAVQRYNAFGSVDSEIANPLPSMPCQRPNILTPSGGAPPVSRKRATAALKVP